eukprot:15447405-Alexandrium_andersonii.AAC.1
MQLQWHLATSNASVRAFVVLPQHKHADPEMQCERYLASTNAGGSAFSQCGAAPPRALPFLLCFLGLHM